MNKLKLRRIYYDKKNNKLFYGAYYAYNLLGRYNHLIRS